MNLWLRLIWFALTAWRRPAIREPGVPSVLAFQVLPFDLDLSLHMNNGRYLTIMDLGRLDLLVRLGLWGAVRRHGWTPILSSVVLRYRRELRPFARYRLETRLVSWGGASAIMEQVFVATSGPYAGQVAARALVKAGLYSRSERRFIDTARLMAEIGVTASSPPVTPEIEAFIKADAALKIAAAGYGSGEDGA
jgi:acyl-CoA thioesterase FadM